MGFELLYDPLKKQGIYICNTTDKGISNVLNGNKDTMDEFTDYFFTKFGDMRHHDTDFIYDEYMHFIGEI